MKVFFGTLFICFSLLACNSIHQSKPAADNEIREWDIAIVPASVRVDPVSGEIIENRFKAAPGKDSSVYDYKGMSDRYGKFIFDKLYPGNYFVYASGYDAIWGDNVTGYLPITLNQENIVDNFAELTLPVSE